MENCSPKGRVRRFTDEDLRQALSRGVKPADFAREYGVSRQAVNARVKQLQLTTTAAAVAPTESQRFVRQTIDVMAQLQLNLERANRLQDACDLWLQDPSDPTRYNLEPRSSEVDITYEVEVDAGDRLVIQKRKKRLSELMAVLSDGRDEDGARFVGIQRGEFRHADPRELILKTQQETRATVALFADLIQKLTDARVMQEWREAALEEIAKESPDCARRIAERLQRSIVLHAAFAGSGAVPRGDVN